MMTHFHSKMKHKCINLYSYDLDEEQWKDIPDFEGIYEASTFGRIRTKLGKATYTKTHGVRIWKQRILKFKGHNCVTGYRVTLWKNGICKDFLVARLVASTFLSNELKNKNLTVNHIDGNRFNNNISNLEWCTLRENIKKAYENNLYPQRNIILIDKETKKEIFFNSLSKASLYMKRNVGYISAKIKQSKFENSHFIWYLPN